MGLGHQGRFDTDELCCSEPIKISTWREKKTFNSHLKLYPKINSVLLKSILIWCQGNLPESLRKVCLHKRSHVGCTQDTLLSPERPQKVSATRNQQVTGSVCRDLVQTRDLFEIASSLGQHRKISAISSFTRIPCARAYFYIASKQAQNKMR